LVGRDTGAADIYAKYDLVKKKGAEE